MSCCAWWRRGSATRCATAIRWARSHLVTRAPAISLVWAATSLWPSCRIYGTPMDAGIVAARLIGALREPVQLATTSLIVTPSVGIAVFPRDGADAEDFAS